MFTDNGRGSAADQGGPESLEVKWSRFASHGDEPTVYDFPRTGYGIACAFKRGMRRMIVLVPFDE